MALPFTLKKSILRQKKKNYENSNISPCKNNIIFKKNPLKETQIISRHYITLELISKFNTSPK
jgi:hypothetical protein